MAFEVLKTELGDVAFTTATPFDSDGDVYHEKLAENLRELESAGGNVFIPCGNTGEFYSLTPEERIQVVETHVEATSEEATIVAGAGGSHRSVVETAETYERLGVDSVMIMHPVHTYAHERGLETYYSRIATATDLGVVVYKRSHDVSADVLDAVTRHDNVVGVKYAVNDVGGFAATVSRIGDRVAWLNGIAERFAPSFAIEGADGFTTGIGNFLPRRVLSLRDALEAEEWERAREIRDQLQPFESIRDEPGEDNSISSANNVPVVKFGMELAGFYGGRVREPLVELPDRDKERVREYYERVRADEASK